MKYTEIFKLKDMLEKEGIPFEYENESEFFKEVGLENEQYHICYPVFNVNKRVCSVIQGKYTYGADLNLLEIMGLTAEEEDSVVGYLTAEEVFERIKKHYEGGRNE